MIEIQVYFKRSIWDVLRNLFVKKSKRFHRDVTFVVSDYDMYDISEDGSLRVEFPDAAYIYPSHKIARIKVIK